jgi:hypothetical protein
VLSPGSAGQDLQYLEALRDTLKDILHMVSECKLGVKCDPENLRKFDNRDRDTV